MLLPCRAAGHHVSSSHDDLIQHSRPLLVGAVAVNALWLSLPHALRALCVLHTRCPHCIEEKAVLRRKGDFPPVTGQGWGFRAGLCPEPQHGTAHHLVALGSQALRGRWHFPSYSLSPSSSPQLSCPIHGLSHHIHGGWRAWFSNPGPPWAEKEAVQGSYRPPGAPLGAA